MTMVDYFPGVPRRQQVDVLTQLEREWGPRRAFVVEMPVGAGKSHVAATLAAWAASWDVPATVVTPDSLLQRQYERDFPKLASVWGGDEYRCLTYRSTCAETRKRKKGVNCPDCPHARAIGLARSGCQRLMHHYTYLGTAPKGQRKQALVGYPKLLIIDEAHGLEDKLHTEVKLWRARHHWPRELATVEDFVAWVDRSKNLPFAWERGAAKNILLAKGRKAFLGKKRDVNRGKDDDVLTVAPLTPRHNKPFLWPKTVQNVVLLSATPGDVARNIGLDLYFDVRLISSGSPIPPTNRPFYYTPITRMSHATRELGLRDLAEWVTALLAQHPASGIVHTTYADAADLRRYLTHPRLLWHDRGNKAQIYEQFTRAAGSGRVLVASGMAEGVDLVGDLARWQVLTKVPYPSLEDPFVAAKAEADPAWYSRKAVTAVLQAYGRVCRGPKDHGATYMCDSKFRELYRNCRYMFPNWFQDALRGLDG